MLSPILSKFQEIIKEEHMKGNTVVLLTKGGNDYYPLEKHYSYIKSISPEILDKGMRKVTLAFANKNIETRVFLDPNLKEGDWVATVGYFYTFDGILTYSAKGGITKNLLNVGQLTEIYKTKMYDMGPILKVSKADTTTLYPYSSEIKQLEKSSFYYAIETSLKNELERRQQLINKKDDIINTAELPEEPETEEQEIEE